MIKRRTKRKKDEKKEAPKEPKIPGITELGTPIGVAAVGCLKMLLDSVPQMQKEDCDTIDTVMGEVLGLDGKRYQIKLQLTSSKLLQMEPGTFSMAKFGDEVPEAKAGMKVEFNNPKGEA